MIRYWKLIYLGFFTISFAFYPCLSMDRLKELITSPASQIIVGATAMSLGHNMLHSVINYETNIKPYFPGGRRKKDNKMIVNELNFYKAAALFSLLGIPFGTLIAAASRCGSCPKLEPEDLITPAICAFGFISGASLLGSYLMTPPLDEDATEEKKEKRQKKLFYSRLSIGVISFLGVSIGSPFGLILKRMFK